MDFSTVELTELLQQMEHSMRRRKSTLRQLNYFNSLLYDLSLREDIPKDYLCMKKRLLQLEHRKQCKIQKGNRENFEE